MLPHKVPNFLELLEEVLTDELKDKKEKYKDYEYKHNPSSSTMVKDDGTVVGACMRQLWYRATKVPESNPNDLTGLLQMGFGDGIHNWLLAKLQKSKRITLLKEAGGRVTIDPLTREVSFRLDGLVTHKGELGGFELKTTQGFGLSYMLKEGGPKEDHLLQVLDYFATNEAIRWFGLVYVARDSGYRAEFHITKEDDGFYIKGIKPDMPKRKITDLSFDKVKARWKILEGHIERKEEPPRDFKVVFNDEGKIVDSRVKKGYKYKSHFKCTYCSHKDYCWSQPGAQEDSVQVVK
jgi:hypothetical protein